MSSYGFSRKGTSSDEAADKLDLTGIGRRRLEVDPVREEDAIKRGAAMGFVERESAPVSGRRRPPAVPQKNIFIKGPADTLDWFIDYTNERGHRSYWQALEELRTIIENR